MQSIIDDYAKQELLRLAEQVADGYRIRACCIYGSKVAGYARPDSDYDLLLVLDDYDKLIEYIYKHGNNGLDASILIVDSIALLKDAERSALGEFVAGRLLHPYYPLLNEDYLKQVEISYKRRVIVESIRELASKTIFYKELLIPVRYFLLAKIKQRAKVYPHALYSYIRTYTSKYADRNLEFSLNGFVKALEGLDAIRFDGEYVVINDDIDIGMNYKLRARLSRLSNGLFAYLVHFYAGKRTLNFLKKEAKSKLERRREIKDINMEFLDPERVLRLKGCKLLFDDWLEQFLKDNGIDGKLEIKNLGDIHATTKLYEANGFRFVAKYYCSLKRLKWVGLNFWLAGLIRFESNPNVRQLNEYKAIRALSSLGFNVPELLALSYRAKITITRYIEGITLDSIIASIIARKSDDTSNIERFGELLYNIHKHNYAIIDTKASNVIISNDKLYLTDLEQFKVSSNKDPSWDIICFIYYSLKFVKDEHVARMIVRAFLDGYTNRCYNDCKDRIRVAMDKKYFIPFYPAMVYYTTKAIWDEMSRYT